MDREDTWADGIADGYATGPPKVPVEDANVETRLCEVIRGVGESGGAGAEGFLDATRSLAIRVGQRLLTSYRRWLDPVDLHPGASPEEAGQVIQSLWYEVLFGDSQAWRHLQAPDQGGRPSAYLWEIAKRQVLSGERGADVPLDTPRREGEPADRQQNALQEHLQYRPPVTEQQAWKYVRQTDSLSVCADSIAQEILPDITYRVWHARIWGAGDSARRLPFQQVGSQVGILEDAARKRFDRAEAQLTAYVRTHPEDERVKRLEELKVHLVDGLLVWGDEEDVRP